VWSEVYPCARAVVALKHMDAVAWVIPLPLALCVVNKLATERIVL
jgi:hypothetical protein